MASSASAISSRQLQELARLAGRQRRLLMFAEERLFHPALTFLRRMLSEKSGLWRPQYLRGLSISGTSNGDAPPFASLVEEALALCARLIEAQPDTISGIACRTSGHAGPGGSVSESDLWRGEGRISSDQRWQRLKRYGSGCSPPPPRPSWSMSATPGRPSKSSHRTRPAWPPASFTPTHPPLFRTGRERAL